MTKLVALDAPELQCLEITCQCGTRVILRAGNHDPRVPHACPSCLVPFDALGVVEPVRQFFSLYRMLAHPEQKVRFRVLVDQAEPAG